MEDGSGYFSSFSLCIEVNHRSIIRILRFFFILKFVLTNFTNFISVEKNSQKIRNFANHRCLTCFDVLECIVHAFIRTTYHSEVQTAFVSLFYIFINMKP